VGKRRLSDNCGDILSQGNVPKTPRFDASAVMGQLKGQDALLKEVKTKLGKVDYDAVIGQVLPQPVKDVIVNLGKALDLLLKSQENLTSALIDAVKVSEDAAKSQPKVIEPNKPKGKATVAAPPPPDPKVVAERKVKQAIREAEKKTLLFNLDMGKVPTINKETLSRKVTLALAEKASSGEHDYDIKDAVDDILSCTKLEFLGITSKKFFNKKNLNDARNDTFCTLPVRFEFPDKPTRIQAEKTLRKVCKVSCAVPYPKKLRTMLDNLITEGKVKYPNSFIRTQVNVDQLTVEAQAKSGEGWIDLGLKRAIPLNILDISTEVNSTAVVPISASATPASSQDEVMCIS
jgi:hypothetical protein